MSRETMASRVAWKYDATVKLAAVTPKRIRQQPHEVSPDGEARHHHQHGQELGRDEKGNWIERHRFQRVHLLGHFLGADFCRKSGPERPITTSQS